MTVTKKIIVRDVKLKLKFFHLKFPFYIDLFFFSFLNLRLELK